MANIKEIVEGSKFGTSNSIWLTLGLVAAVAGVGELNKRRSLIPGQQRQFRLPYTDSAPQRSWDW